MHKNLYSPGIANHYPNESSTVFDSIVFNENTIVQLGVTSMVFNTTFNNISVISWRSVSLVEETGVPRENHWPAGSHWQTLSHNVIQSTPGLSRNQLHVCYNIFTLSVITYCYPLITLSYWCPLKSGSFGENMLIIMNGIPDLFIF